jgi:hypothetical protein
MDGVQGDIVKFGCCVFESLEFGTYFASNGLLENHMPVISGKIDLFGFG